MDDALDTTDKTDIEGLVRFLVTSLVDSPDSVSITRATSGDVVRFEISVDPADVGKVIGRQGRIIKAIRTLARAAASCSGDLVEVDVVG